jgi:hypothetical protein
MNNRKLLRNVPIGYALRVRHVHDLETLELLAQGKPPRYVTRASIYLDKRDSRGKLITDDVINPPLVTEDARCSHRDNPSRKVGYNIAVTRALRALSAYRRYGGI